MSKTTWAAIVIAVAIGIAGYLWLSGDAAPPTDTNPTAGLTPSHFLAGGVEGDITTVDCTLDNGATTTCYKITTKGVPRDHDVGPFCPRSITDNADAGGIWLKDGTVYDVDGKFVAGLAELYDDDKWQLYDPKTGAVNVTLTKEACAAAARPDVDEQYHNHCVECLLDYIDGDVSETTLIPVTPVPRSSPGELRNGPVGLALNGVRFDAPAPVHAILAAHTIAAFDDCGGHVNLHVGYHYHAATGCGTQVKQPDDHAPLIGYARDGYGIYAMADANGAEATGLDACRGHSDAVRGYHYHAASAGENMFIGCFHGHVVETARPRRGPPGSAPRDGKRPQRSKPPG